MSKGVDLASAVPAMARFSSVGILVHVYLMYGFPGQTVRETVDALEVVRQLFANGLVHSAYWHRFALTVHSAMGADPAGFGMGIAAPARRGFAENEIPVVAGVDPRVIAMGSGLHKAVYNWTRTCARGSRRRSRVRGSGQGGYWSWSVGKWGLRYTGEALVPRTGGVGQGETVPERYWTRHQTGTGLRT
jgi:hypothetical protein